MSLSFAAAERPAVLFDSGPDRPPSFRCLAARRRAASRKTPLATPLENWVEEAARLTKPNGIVYCDGSEAENQRIIAETLRAGDTERLNEETYPNSYLHRSHPTDVARTEQVTFICSPSKDDAGPTNNWMSPVQAKSEIAPLLDGSMRGRTMYVVPYLMGPVDSPISK